MSGWGSQEPRWVCKRMEEAKQTRSPRAQIPSCPEEGDPQDWEPSREPVLVRDRDPWGSARAPQKLSPLESIPEPH